MQLSTNIGYNIPTVVKKKTVKSPVRSSIYTDKDRKFFLLFLSYKWWLLLYVYAFLKAPMFFDGFKGDVEF